MMSMVIFVAGCEKISTIAATKNEPASLSGSQGLIHYLKDLPAVKSVQHWENKYGDGLLVVTEHYKVYTTLMDPLMLWLVPGFVESAYQGYQKQLPIPIETKTKFDIYLFADRSQWEDFTRTFAVPNAELYLKIRKGAYYLNGACVAYNIGRTITFSAIGHEGWHQFNSRHFAYRLPSWLDEGIATHFEQTRSENGWFYFEPWKNLARLGALRKALLENRMIPLEKLITLNPGEVVGDADQSTLMNLYAQSYALVRFLREEEYGRRLAKFHNMLTGALDGTWPLEGVEKIIASDRNIPLTTGWNKFVATKLFKYYINEDFKTLNEEYLAFCRKIVYRVRLK